MDKQIIKNIKEMNLNKRRFKKHIVKFCNQTMRYWVVKFIYTKKPIEHSNQIKEILNKFFISRGACN